eukprot:12919970-Prorocentrum_lima.AAC.1
MFATHRELDQETVTREQQPTTIVTTIVTDHDTTRPNDNQQTVHNAPQPGDTQEAAQHNTPTGATTTRDVPQGDTDDDPYRGETW